MFLFSKSQEKNPKGIPGIPAGMHNLGCHHDFANIHRIHLQMHHCQILNIARYYHGEIINALLTQLILNVPVNG